MKYLIILLNLISLSCSNSDYINSLNKSSEDLKKSIDSLNCMIEIHKEDSNITYEKVCNYLKKPKNCDLAYEEVIDYFDWRCK